MYHRLLAAASIVALISASAHARSDYLDSVLAAVESSNGQAYLYLNRGNYKAERSGVTLMLEIPAKMRSQFRFDLVQRTMRSALWEFPQPVFLTVKKTVLGQEVCVRLRTTKLRYENGLPSGDWTITPSPRCPVSQSEMILELDSVMAVNPDTVSLLKGGVFRTAASLKPCINSSCTSLGAGALISRAVFFGAPAPDDPKPALRVGFSQGSTIQLPAQGYLKLDVGSEARFQTLDYDFGADEGDGVLGLFNVTVSDGVLAGGPTLLRVAPGSALRAEQVAMRREGAEFFLDRGSFTGTLGSDSILSMGVVEDKASTLTFLSGKATLADLQLTSEADQREFVVRRGSFDAQVKSADLWMNPATNLRLGYTNLSFVLGCADGASASCVGARWGSKRIETRGQINGFATHIDGGQFPLSDAGSVRVHSGGKIEADVLMVDSTQPVSPITGKIKTLELAFEGENLLFDKTTKLRAASVGLKSDNLTFVAGEPLPVGTLRLQGAVDRAEAAGVGEVSLVNGKAEIVVERAAGDKPRISDGRLSAGVRARLEGGNFADGTLEAKNLRYYAGAGRGDVTVSIDKAEYTFTTPGDSRPGSGDVAKVNVKINPVPITFGLRQPLVLGPLALEAFGSKWSLAEVKDVPLRMFVSVPRGELVYAPVEVAGATVCAPKVDLVGQNTNLDAKISLAASSQQRRVSVHDANLAQGIDADADDRDCTYVAALICSMIGSLGGPIGAAALGVLCAVKIEDAEADLGVKIRDQSVEHVHSFRYDFSQ